MKNNKTKPIHEIDDFWNDCIKENYSKQKRPPKKLSSDFNNIYLNNIKNRINSYKIKSQQKNKRNQRKTNSRKKTYQNSASSLNETDNFKTKFLSTTQSSCHFYKNIQKVLKQEDDLTQKINKKFIDLYQRDIFFKESLEKKNNKRREKKEKSKYTECTFKPIKCRNLRIEKKIKKKYLDSNIYERSVKDQQKHDEKIALIYNENNKVNNFNKSYECFFHPKLNNTKKNMKKVLNNKKWADKANNDSNQLFLIRYMKARENDYEKKKFLNYAKQKYSYNYLLPKKNAKNISGKELLNVKKNLHNALYSIKNFLLDDDDNDNNFSA